MRGNAEHKRSAAGIGYCKQERRGIRKHEGAIAWDFRGALKYRYFRTGGTEHGREQQRQRIIVVGLAGVLI